MSFSILILNQPHILDCECHISAPLQPASPTCCFFTSSNNGIATPRTGFHSSILFEARRTKLGATALRITPALPEVLAFLQLHAVLRFHRFHRHRGCTAGGWQRDSKQNGYEITHTQKSTKTIKRINQDPKSIKRINQNQRNAKNNRNEIQEKQSKARKESHAY